MGIGFRKLASRALDTAGGNEFRCGIGDSSIITLATGAGTRLSSKLGIGGTADGTARGVFGSGSPISRGALRTPSDLMVNVRDFSMIAVRAGAGTGRPGVRWGRAGNVGARSRAFRGELVCPALPTVAGRHHAVICTIAHRSKVICRTLACPRSPRKSLERETGDASARRQANARFGPGADRAHGAPRDGVGCRIVHGRAKITCRAQTRSRQAFVGAGTDDGGALLISALGRVIAIRARPAACWTSIDILDSSSESRQAIAASRTSGDAITFAFNVRALDGVGATGRPLIKTAPGAPGRALSDVANVAGVVVVAGGALTIASRAGICTDTLNRLA